MSRGFNLGFGWLLGATFAVLCCLAAAVLAQRLIASGAAWWEKKEIALRHGEAAARKSPTTALPGPGAVPGSQQSKIAEGAHVATNGGDPKAATAVADRSCGQDTDDAEPSRPSGNGSPGQHGFEILSTRFYYSTRGDAPEPIIEMRVRNNTPFTVGRVHFCATLRSPGRELPWAEDYFGYAIDGGLKPGEEAVWQLAPDSNSDWAETPRDETGLSLAVVLIGIEDANGNPIPGQGEADGPVKLEYANRLPKACSRAPEATSPGKRLESDSSKVGN